MVEGRRAGGPECKSMEIGWRSLTQAELAGRGSPVMLLARWSTEEPKEGGVEVEELGRWAKVE